MKISKWLLYFIGLIVLTSPLILLRLQWLDKSVRTKAVVLYIGQTGTKTRQTYPMFQYKTPSYTVSAPGNWNLPYEAGDSVTIRYNPDDLTNFKIDTVYDCWKDLLIYASPFFIFYTFLFLGKDIIPKAVTFARKRLNKT